MNEYNHRQADEERIDKEAAAWLIKRDRGFTPEDQDDFFQWLGEDSRHGDFFVEQQKTWREFDLLAQWLPEHSEEPNPDLLANGMPKRHWSHWRSTTAIAASFVAIFCVWAVWMGSAEKRPENRAEHIVAGNYGYFVLEDGSELDMNNGAEVLVEYSDEIRLVKLLTGEVHFKVAKNPERPFVVRARGTDVRAVGTAFNVLLSQDKVEVLVTEGRVRMEQTLPVGNELGTSKSSPIGLDLVPGQRSVVILHTETPLFETGVVEPEAIEKILAWKHETLDFDETPLSDAVLEFNRRNEIQLVIADEVLKSKSIVGTFRSNNLDGFANLLETVFVSDMEVDRSSESEIVLRSL